MKDYEMTFEVRGHMETVSVQAMTPEQAIENLWSSYGIYIKIPAVS